MANTIFTRWIKVQNSKLYGWDSSTTVRAMLEDNASTYVPDPDHETVQEVIDGGFVELSASGYSRATLTGKTVYQDDTNDEAQLRCDNPNFGAIESGKTIKGVLLFIRVGSSDSASSDIPVAYIDTATGLPLSTGGGSVVLSVPVTGIFKAYQP